MPVATGYILPLELITFYDKRRVLQLASDTDDTPASVADLSVTSSDAYIFINNCILSASSDLDSHCQQGKRYTRANLEAIITAANAAPTDSTLVKRALLLKQLVADLTYGMLMSRRGMNSDRLATLAPRYEKAQEALERLALGITVFDLTDNIDAGVPDSRTFGTRVYRPTRDNLMFGIWPTDGAYGNPGYSGYFFGRW